MSILLKRHVTDDLE